MYPGVNLQDVFISGVRKVGTVGKSGNTFIQHLARHVQETAHERDVDNMLLMVPIDTRF